MVYLSTSFIVCNSHTVAIQIFLYWVRDFLYLPWDSAQIKTYERVKSYTNQDLNTPKKTTQIKDFASPILAAVYTAHQAKRLINAPAVHRPEPIRAGEHVPT